MKDVTIAEHHLRPGEFKEIIINIARLPSRTQIDTPIYAYRGLEDGPVLALTAGMHGDEINGMEIVRRILDTGHNRFARSTPFSPLTPSLILLGWSWADPGDSNVQ